MDLRLIGLWRGDIRLDTVLRLLRPMAAFGAGLAILTGALLFIVQASDYARLPLFALKLTLIAIGLAHALAWGDSARPRPARPAAARRGAVAGDLAERARLRPDARLSLSGFPSAAIWARTPATTPWGNRTDVHRDHQHPDAASSGRAPDQRRRRLRRAPRRLGRLPRRAAVRAVLRRGLCAGRHPALPAALARRAAALDRPLRLRLPADRPLRRHRPLRGQPPARDRRAARLERDPRRGLERAQPPDPVHGLHRPGALPALDVGGQHAGHPLPRADERRGLLQPRRALAHRQRADAASWSAAFSAASSPSCSSRSPRSRCRCCSTGTSTT